tara:strand:- start:1 stop:1056 length:1056 start_codon:yes stop_codon:yes gene_type:complete
MEKVIEKITVEEFRHFKQTELEKADKNLAEWLEVLRRMNGKREDKFIKPWIEKGRSYINFQETFYHTLRWYKLWKIKNFNHLGWRLDDGIIDNIKQKFSLLIKYALELNGDKASSDYFKQYDPCIISRYTAIDYKFQNITGADINNVLDFGSGIGRQAFQWCSRPNVNFFSIDVTESLYLLQNEVYNLLFPEKLREYFYDPQRFQKADFYSGKGKLYHMPTWKMDLLPDNYFDLIVCVQVLQEINETTLSYALQQFRRIIKKNGLLFIRDKEFWTPAHKVRVGRELLKQGWELSFKYAGDEGIDIEGVPRLWVFTNKDNKDSFKYLSRIKKWLLPSYPISYSSWKDFGLPI